RGLGLVGDPGRDRRAGALRLAPRPHAGNHARGHDRLPGARRRRGRAPLRRGPAPRREVRVARASLGRTALLAVSVLAPAPAAGPETHHLKPTVGHPTFAVRPPVLTVKPGDVVESESLWGDWYEKAGGKWPGEVGPIAIAGAEPGDTLVVEI